MARFFKKREEIKGMSPGSLVFIGNKKVENIDDFCGPIYSAHIYCRNLWHKF